MDRYGALTGDHTSLARIGPAYRALGRRRAPHHRLARRCRVDGRSPCRMAGRDDILICVT